VKAAELAREFEGLSFRAVPEYITETRCEFTAALLR